MIWAGPVLLAACSVGAPAESGPSANPGVSPPPVAQFDYQLQEGYPPPSGTGVVVRDHRDQPAPGLYTICYVNALQAQPEETGWWEREHPDLLLRNGSGELVYDDEWNEPLFDVSTAAGREELLEVQKPWLQECADKGFRAVEPDGQDSYTRSDGLLTFDMDRDYMRMFTAYAHSLGLAVGQKNAGEEYGSTGRDEVGFDFAVAEECGHWDECELYTGPYGGAVLQIEYTDQPVAAFETSCERYRGQHAVIRRDRALQPPGHPDHSYSACS